MELVACFARADPGEALTEGFGTMSDGKGLWGGQRYRHFDVLRQLCDQQQLLHVAAFQSVAYWQRCVINQGLWRGILVRIKVLVMIRKSSKLGRQGRSRF